MPVTRHVVHQPWISITAAAAGFDPNTIAGLVGWWDADDAASITASAGKVSQWNNKKTSATTHLTQATSTSQPTTGSHTQNGKNVIACDGNDTLNAASNLMTGATAGTLFAVIKKGGAGNEAFHGYIGGRADPWYTYGSMIYETFGTDTQIFWTPSFTVTNWNIYEVRGATNDWAAYGNGTLSHSTSTNTVLFTSGPTRLGGNDQAFFSGDIAEYLIYSQVLTAGERTSVRDYLNTKWAIY